MRSVRLVVVSMLLLAGITAKAEAANDSKPGRLTMSFDSDWRFLKADAPGAEQPDFSDTAWRRVSVPHDWSIEGPFAETNATRGSGAFLPSGIAWYRKHFIMPDVDARGRVFIEFDGVMANSDVWINGFHLGKRPYGYVSFAYDLTGHLNFGEDKPNVLAVRVDTSQQPASRWYTGAGIYRHVRLVITDPVHIDQWGTFVTTPKITVDQTIVHVQNTVTNQSDAAREVTVQVTILGPDGKSVKIAESAPQTVPPGQSVDFQQELSVKSPKLWDIDHPLLYRAVSKVCDGNAVLDDQTTPFGIREFRFDAATGFWLNGRNFKIKGVCLHHDASAFGAAVPLEAWERRLAALKPLGVNAIRTAHNPPSPEFLDLCDRMGFLVMDELFDCWTVAKNPYDYHLYFNDWAKIDARDTVRRDRNHPSIILYSAGNEIHDTPKEELAKSILSGLVQVFHENDPTRPVTQALFRPNVSHDYDNGLADMLDVIGTNYRDNELLAAQQAKPTRKIIGTEQRHDRADLALRCATTCPRRPVSLERRRLPGRIAQLAPRRRRFRVARPHRCSETDGVRTPELVVGPAHGVHRPPRPVPLRRRRPTPVLTPLTARQVLFSDWTPTNSTPHEEDVEVFSNCQQVELFLNGKSLGAKPLNADASPRTWKVPFAPGTLKAVGKNRGRVVATYELRTAGPAFRIALKADRDQLAPVWDDVSFVRATVVDKNGVIVPGASNLITFQATGPGVVAAVDSANNASHEPFQASERHAYQGRCFALVKATAPSGKIRLTASAPGLKPDSISIRAVPPSTETL